jgi:hypothetical protein
VPNYMQQAQWKKAPRRGRGRISPGPNTEVHDAVPLGRRKQIPENKPWQRRPANFPGQYVTEWAVWWVLVIHGIGPQKRKLRPGIDFQYQVGLAAPGMFRNKPFTRGDFVIDKMGKGRRGVVLDPVSILSHPHPWLDIRKRDILARGGWQVIYLDDFMLMRDPVRVVNLALQGIDVSGRGMNVW